MLGAILLNNEVLIHATELLSPDDFYRTGHTMLFEAMLGLERDSHHFGRQSLPAPVEDAVGTCPEAVVPCSFDQYPPGM